MENSSPTNSGPDSEVASVDDLPADGGQQLEPGYTKEDLTNKMAAATSYVGSFFNPSAWKHAADKSPEAGAGEGESVERKNSTAGAGTGIISSSLFSAIGKVQGFTKVSPTEETKEENTEDGDNDNETAAGGFFSAFSKIGISGISSSGTVENLAAAGAEDKDKTPTEEAAEDGDERKRDTWGNSLSNAFNKVGRVATDYSKGKK